MAEAEKVVDRVAARLWLAEVQDAGVPQSAIDARTPDAFQEESESTKARWRKFARAALEVAR